MTLCVDGAHIFGSYSGIGQINGTVTNRIATGTWKEAGYTEEVSGGFYWQLNNDEVNVKFTGYYWYDSTPCDTSNTWNGRLYDPQIDESLCLPIEANQESSIGGHWTTGEKYTGIDDLWICVNGDTFEASSNINPFNYTTYSYGRAFYANGKVAQGSGFYSFGDHFYNVINYMVLTGPNTLVTMDYDTTSTEFAPGTYDTVTHTQTTWTRSGGASQKECTQHRSLAPVTWQGAWTDTTHGTGSFYTCVIAGPNGSKLVSGVFSEYGWVIGTVSDDGYTLTGTFYESGANGAVGNFSLTMSENGQLFNGFYTLESDPTLRNTWVESRIDITKDVTSKCWLEDVFFSVAGSWIVDQPGVYFYNYMDICIGSDGSFEASYEFANLSFPGYIYGTAYDATSVKGTFYEQQYGDITESVGIMRLTLNGLQFSTWNTPVPSEYFVPCVGSDPNPNFNHETYVLQRSTRTVGDCSRNKSLRDGDVVESSNSVMLVPSLALIVIFCLFSLF